MRLTPGMDSAIGGWTRGKTNPRGVGFRIPVLLPAERATRPPGRPERPRPARVCARPSPPPFGGALGYDPAMARLLFWGFVALGLAIAWLALMQPRRLGRLGRRARTLGYAYVAAVLIGSALRLLFGWGT